MTPSPPSIQIRVKFSYSPLCNAFEKETNAIEDRGKNQAKAIKGHGKEIIGSTEVIKNDLNIDRSGASHEKQKNI